MRDRQPAVQQGMYSSLPQRGSPSRLRESSLFSRSGSEETTERERQEERRQAIRRALPIKAAEEIRRSSVRIQGRYRRSEVMSDQCLWTGAAPSGLQLLMALSFLVQER